MKLWRKTSEEITGFLDHGTELTGELQFSGMLRIDGNFHGSIANGEILAIGEHANVHADIKVAEIEIYGQVFGNVEVTRRAEIFPTGRLHGDLITPVLVVQEGGIIDGRSRMPMDAASAPAETIRESTSVATSQVGSPQLESQSTDWT
jgi:cytoskeletal protein CcmA (bactofilin family)